MPRAALRAGKTFDGFISHCGSKAGARRICWPRSALLYLVQHQIAFLDAEPCSPVRQPPPRHRASVCRCRQLPRGQLPRIIDVVEDQAMNVAVAGMENIRNAQGRSRRRISPRPPQHMGELAQRAPFRPCRYNRQSGRLRRETDLRPFQISAASRADCDSLIVISRGGGRSR